MKHYTSAEPNFTKVHDTAIYSVVTYSASIL